jgi:hypothetical protein
MAWEPRVIGQLDNLDWTWSATRHGGEKAFNRQPLARSKPIGEGWSGPFSQRLGA